MAPTAPQQPGDAEAAPEEDLPAVPTAVASGVEGSGDGVGYGAVALGARLGTVTCGPNGEMAPASPQEPGDTEGPDEELPAVPTAVASGVGGSGEDLGYGAVALGALVALAGTAGVVALRRSITE